MNTVEKYQEILRRSIDKTPVGYLPYKIRPITAYGEMVFSKIIESKVNKKQAMSFIGRLLSFVEIERLKPNLTEENYDAAGFNRKLELNYSIKTPSEMISFKQHLIDNTISSISGISHHDVSITFGEFVHYPPVKHLDYDDIPDLRLSKAGGGGN